MRHHQDACKQLLEMLLGIKIESITMSTEETIALDFDSKGIRLDVFIKDINRMFDVELQVANTKELPERARNEKAREAAINLLKMNILSPEQIAQAQGLSLEEVLELQKNILVKE